MRMTARKSAWFIVLLQFLVGTTCQTCPGEVVHGLTWSETKVGQNQTQECQRGEPGEAIRRCLTGGVWGSVDDTSCSLQSLLDIYGEARNTSYSVGQLTAVASSLASITNDADSVRYSGRLVTAVDTLLALFTKSGLSDVSTDAADTYIQNILSSADNLLDSERYSSLWATVHEFKDRDFFLKFLRGLEGFGDTVTRYLDTSGRGTLTTTTTTNFQSKYEVVTSVDEVVVQEFAEQSTKITIPKSALTKQDSTRNVSVATLVFKFTVRNLLPKPRSDASVYVSAENVSSVLVSSSIFPAPSTGFVGSVTIVMRDELALPNSTCSFLNHSVGSSVWVEDLTGCEKPVFNSDKTVTCTCSHLTTFVVLGKFGTRGRLPNLLLTALVFCLVFTAITFCLLLYANRKFDSDRASIVMCFLATLFTGHVIIISGLYAIDNVDACRAVALFHHYFQLSYSFWMLAQAVQLVLKVTYKTTETGTVAQFIALGWITPLLVVAGTAGLHLDNYGVGNYCTLPLGSGTSFALIVPVALVGCTNFVCLFYAFYNYYYIKKNDKKCLAEMIRILPNIRACLIVLPVEILEWIFSALSTEYEYVVFDVFWGISAVAMSVLILLFYGIGSSEVAEEFEKHFGPCCWRKKNCSAVRDSPRPGWRDEISQISQYREASSIMRDLDSTTTIAGNGTTSMMADGCSGINNGGLEVDDVLSHGRELNDVSGGSNHLASSVSSSFMLKTKLKVFPIRKSQQQDTAPISRLNVENHR